MSDDAPSSVDTDDQQAKLPRQERKASRKQFESFAGLAGLIMTLVVGAPTLLQLISGDANLVLVGCLGLVLLTTAALIILADSSIRRLSLVFIVLGCSSSSALLGFDIHDSVTGLFSFKPHPTSTSTPPPASAVPASFSITTPTRDNDPVAGTFTVAGDVDGLESGDQLWLFDINPDENNWPVFVRDGRIERDLAARTWQVQNNLSTARPGSLVAMHVVAADRGCDRDIEARPLTAEAARFYVLPSGCTDLGQRIVKVAG